MLSGGPYTGVAGSAVPGGVSAVAVAEAGDVTDEHLLGPRVCPLVQRIYEHIGPRSNITMRKPCRDCGGLDGVIITRGASRLPGPRGLRLGVKILAFGTFTKTFTLMQVIVTATLAIPKWLAHDPLASTSRE